MKKPNFWTIFTILIVVAFVISVIHTEFRIDADNEDMSKHATYAGARIDDIHVGTLKFGRKIIYYYSFSSTSGVVSSYQSTPITREFINEEKLRGKVFPVIYSSVNPENNHLLIFPEDFEECKLAFPDSLSWVNGL